MRLSLLTCLCAAVLAPLDAHGSFGGTPCRDFTCYFGFFGLLVGVLGGLPISGLIFILLHLGFCNPGRSKGKQLFVGGLFGMIAFGISAAVASYVATLEVSTQSRNAFASFLAMYLVLAILAVIYVRSSPRSRKRVA